MQSSTMTLSARSHMAITGVLAVLFVAALSPLADVMVPALPVATGEVRWRFQVFGTMLAALPQLSFILAAILAIGVFAGHRLAVRGASIAALILAIVAALLVIPFALDFLDMRRLVPLERKGNFDMAAIKTGLFGGLCFLVLAFLGWKGLQASVKEKTTERKQGQGLVVGQE